MPRPAYMAAHSPAGPAPTMITSYASLAVSFIGPQFSVRPPQLQPRSLGIAGKRSLELRTKPNRFDLDIGSLPARQLFERAPAHRRDRKSTRLNSSHGYISYAVFCLKKKKNNITHTTRYMPPALRVACTRQ